ncbi:uncharacterized protein CANTADRAFT_271155 [Suhomyces tanzawaensis NRRL Y-17324]|uniref:Uncharacterized protein n=1 Tax=Suhomyces tanzawaensis NRRL Y-17324 TaxID=984487 RepID=A0A1E4SGN5_9ASCO|nr:uncharacterized protein CANTADRAFT_271155 [Suhomyces tanzawaensis NRRL Y-17324]ODV78625.1 hypothetical protein CANTADRAFT_271155 [Suhomyces tanzawaensis NRRL Y-17324]
MKKELFAERKMLPYIYPRESEPPSGNTAKSSRYGAHASEIRKNLHAVTKLPKLSATGRLIGASLLVNEKISTRTREREGDRCTRCLGRRCRRSGARLGRGSGTWGGSRAVLVDYSAGWGAGGSPVVVPAIVS